MILPIGFKEKKKKIPVAISMDFMHLSFCPPVAFSRLSVPSPTKNQHICYSYRNPVNR